MLLTGGEIAAMAIVDSVVRLLPNVLGNAESHELDSFSTGLLEHPHYTRPVEFEALKFQMFYYPAIMQKLINGEENNP